MLTYEDFPVGRVFDLPPQTITKSQIIEFANEFDPQPFHMDEDSAETHGVGGLMASGWHMCSVLMKMLCDAYLLDSASQGSPGLNEILWKKPVRGGDVVCGTAEVVERRKSKSNPSLGLVNFAYTLKNQHSETVMIVRGLGMISAPQGSSK